MTLTSRFSFIVLALLTLAFALPRFSHAQVTPPSQLRSAIRAALIADPRTASLPKAQLDAIVQILAKQANEQGIEPNDIVWHPAGEGMQQANTAPASSCDAFLCRMSEAFGFIGVDVTIPFFLGMSSMGLIWILAEMIHRHKRSGDVMSVQNVQVVGD